MIDRTENDLVQEQLPLRASILGAREGLLDPSFLLGSDDAALRIELLSELADIVDIVAEIGDVAIVLAICSVLK